jgi:hypothetical protein
MQNAGPIPLYDHRSPSVSCPEQDVSDNAGANATGCRSQLPEPKWELVQIDAAANFSRLVDYRRDPHHTAAIAA